LLVRHISRIPQESLKLTCNLKVGRRVVGVLGTCTKLTIVFDTVRRSMLHRNVDEGPSRLINYGLGPGLLVLWCISVSEGRFLNWCQFRIAWEDCIKTSKIPWHRNHWAYPVLTILKLWEMDKLWNCPGTKSINFQLTWEPNNNGKITKNIHPRTIIIFFIFRSSFSHQQHNIDLSPFLE